jgi:hypothetical protein
MVRARAIAALDIFICHSPVFSGAEHVGAVKKVLTKMATGE